MRLNIDICQRYRFDTDESFWLLTHEHKTPFIYYYIDKINIFIR